MTKTKYYVDANGNYIGAFHKAPPPLGAIEVADGPDHAADKWTGSGWDTSGRPVETTPLEAEELYEILETKGVLAEQDRPRPKA